MALWDGFTSSDARIIVVGATNRPEDVDRAILRRMPRTVSIALPDNEQRAKILRVITAKERLGADVSFTRIAAQTEGYSGSDLKELCRNAVLASVRDLIKSGGASDSLRALTMADFIAAKTSVESAAPGH